MRWLAFAFCSFAVIPAWATDPVAKQPRLTSGTYLLLQKTTSIPVAPVEPAEGTTLQTQVKLTVNGRKVEMRYLDAGTGRTSAKGLSYRGRLSKAVFEFDGKSRRGLQTYRKQFRGRLIKDDTIVGTASESRFSIGGADPILKTTFRLVRVREARPSTSPKRSRINGDG